MTALQLDRIQHAAYRFARAAGADSSEASDYSKWMRKSYLPRLKGNTFRFRRTDREFSDFDMSWDLYQKGILRALAASLPALRDRSRRHHYRSHQAPAARKKISSKIRLLREEGYPGPQASAIAYRMYAKRDVLTSRKRASLKSSQFALPSRRSLPIYNAAHVRAAASRLEEMKHLGHVSTAEYHLARRRIQAARAHFGIRSRK